MMNNRSYIGYVDAIIKSVVYVTLTDESDNVEFTAEAPIENFTTITPVVGMYFDCKSDANGKLIISNRKMKELTEEEKEFITKIVEDSFGN